MSMKHFSPHTASDFLLFLIPTVLIVPDIIMLCLSHGTLIPLRISSLILMSGIYLFVLSLSRNTARTTVFLLPLFALCAFQIVISSLYRDDSAIGVDMFLNVVTTNSTEVIELLSGLIPVLLVIAVLYLSPLIYSCFLWYKHEQATLSLIKSTHKYSIRIILVGILLSIIYCIIVGTGKYLSSFFPSNTFINLTEAIICHNKTLHYPETSKDFSYNATSDRIDEKELYIAVIGETSRADNWQILGYERPTNPRLSLLGDSLISFKKAFSQNNTTHKSVPMLLSTLSPETYNDGICRHKSIITAFKEAGFSTTFISNQERNNSFIDFYADEADNTIYLPHHGSVPFDIEIIPLVDSILNTDSSSKRLIVVHLYGSHFKYRDRYPTSMAHFSPDTYQAASSKNRDKLRNAYDNTILITDYILFELIDRLDMMPYNGGLLFCSDHGEDIFDDKRGKFLHASPSPTYMQLHVPFLVYANSRLRLNHPSLFDNALSNKDYLILTGSSFSHSLLDLAGLNTPYLDYSKSVFSQEFKSDEDPLFLNDCNKTISFREAMQPYDFHLFSNNLNDLE